MASENAEVKFLQVTAGEATCEVCGEMPASVLREENGIGIAACEGCGQDLTDESYRRKAVALEEDCAFDDVGACLTDNEFRVGRTTYLVLTDDEAHEAAGKRIEESLWAFRPSFIARFTEPRLSDAAQKALGQAQEKLCEDANDLVRALIRDIDAFIEAAISEDGRGHFIGSYDGEEREQGDLFLYRQ